MNDHKRTAAAGTSLPPINYISNLDKREKRGGWDGINAAVATGLEERFDVNYVGPVNPPVPSLARGSTLLRRLSGSREKFESFSDARLQRYASGAKSLSDEHAVFDFFHGSTPWILYAPSRPRFAYVDAVFSSYVSLYHKDTRYEESDLERISAIEARWLNSASKVFFTSAWAMNAAQHDYGCSGDNFEVAGVAGAIVPPPKDVYESGRNFLAVVTDFERKGGYITADAFADVRTRYSDASLTFVGVRPPEKVVAQAGVKYAGYFDKTIPSQLKELELQFAGAFAAVFPSSAETSPVIIPELAYFGCPTIAPAKFGIPEMIRDKETGILLHGSVDARTVRDAMLALLEDSGSYMHMRSEARNFSLSNFQWPTVLQKITSSLELAVQKPHVPGSTAARTSTQ